MNFNLNTFFTIGAKNTEIQLFSHLNGKHQQIRKILVFLSHLISQQLRKKLKNSYFLSYVADGAKNTEIQLFSQVKTGAKKTIYKYTFSFFAPAQSRVRDGTP